MVLTLSPITLSSNPIRLSKCNKDSLHSQKFSPKANLSSISSARQDNPFLTKLEDNNQMQLKYSVDPPKVHMS